MTNNVNDTPDAWIERFSKSISKKGRSEYFDETKKSKEKPIYPSWADAGLGDMGSVGKAYKDCKWKAYAWKLIFSFLNYFYFHYFVKFHSYGIHRKV